MIPAGGSGKLVAKVHTALNQSGRLSKGITVTTDAKGAETLSLTLAFTVQPAIEVKPQPQLRVETAMGAARSERVTLHRTDGKPLKVERVEVDDQSLAEMTFGVVPASGEGDGQAGDAWVEAAVAATAPPGNRVTKMRVYTDHPDQPVVDLSLNVRVRPTVEVRPERVTLWVEDSTTAGRSTSVRLSSTRERAFEVKEITSSHPQLFRGVVMGSAAAALHTVKVELVEGATTGSFGPAVNGSLRIATTDADQPVVEVPVTITKRARTMTAPPRVVQPATPAYPAAPARPRALPENPPPSPAPGEGGK